ncbi:hypothetical protein [Baaleninema sp.]|uniref:hypothetical protein n=1 Tax=Baaleninema sp. TaxID=3101197 RepID=UPI003D0234D0
MSAFPPDTVKIETFPGLTAGSSEFDISIDSLSVRFIYIDIPGRIALQLTPLKSPGKTPKFAVF